MTSQIKSLKMADVPDVPVEDENDDNWLYGDSNNESNNAEDQDKQEDNAISEKEPPDFEDEQSKEDDEADQTEHNVTGHLDDEHFEDQPDGEDQENEDEVFSSAQNGEGQQENGDSDSDDSEDDVKVIVGDSKSQQPPAQSYTNLNIKRSNLLVQPSLEKQKQTGKFTTEDFESVGNINGVPAQEFNIDVLEDKPWRKPGADITDYFNYGFTEDTWRAYCERQKRMRVHESGTGLIALGGKDLSSGGINNPQLRQLIPISGDHTKQYVPPPIAQNRKIGSIDVVPSRRDGEENNMLEPPPIISSMGMPPPISHNTIQVMTADKRGYSRGKPFPDMTLPPPNSEDFFHQPPEQPPFYPPYEEPWGNEQQSGWAPGDIKELTPGPMHMGPPPGMVPLSGMPPLPVIGPPPMNMGPPIMGHPPMMIRPPMGQPPHMAPLSNMPPYGPPPTGHMDHLREREHREREMEREHRERERDYRDRDHRDRDRQVDSEFQDKDLRESSEMRDRDRERSRSIKPDRHREKSHRRERSRSRSRRHKSRSRSPSSRHRSKKKSHHKDKDDSD